MSIIMSQIKSIIFSAFLLFILFTPHRAEYLHLLYRCSFEILTTFSFQVRRSSQKLCRCNPFCFSLYLVFVFPHHAEYFHLLNRCSFEILTTFFYRFKIFPNNFSMASSPPQARRTSLESRIRQCWVIIFFCKRQPLHSARSFQNTCPPIVAVGMLGMDARRSKSIISPVFTACSNAFAN